MKIEPLFIFFFLALMVGVFLSKPAFAEEPEPVPGPSSVLVSDPDVTARLDAMQYTLEQIAAALAEEEPVEIATPESAPDYTSQLEVIADGVEQVIENTTPATPEDPVSAFDKPFTEYTTTEALLLFLGVVVVVGGVVLVFLRR